MKVLRTVGATLAWTVLGVCVLFCIIVAVGVLAAWSRGTARIPGLLHAQYETVGGAGALEFQTDATGLLLTLVGVAFAHVAVTSRRAR